MCSNASSEMRRSASWLMGIQRYDRSVVISPAPPMMPACMHAASWSAPRSRSRLHACALCAVNTLSLSAPHAAIGAAHNAMHVFVCTVCVRTDVLCTHACHHWPSGAACCQACHCGMHLWRRGSRSAAQCACVHTRCTSTCMRMDCAAAALSHTCISACSCGQASGAWPHALKLHMRRAWEGAWKENTSSLQKARSQIEHYPRHEHIVE
jgi:hypothetical protein